MNANNSGVMPHASAVANVLVLIPSGFLRFTGQVKSVQLEAGTVGQALCLLAEQFPLLRNQMFTGDNSLRGFINIFLNSKDIRFLQQERTALSSHDVITVLPAVAGG